MSAAAELHGARPPAGDARPAVQAGTLVPLPYRVKARRRETADTTTLTLTPCGEPLAPFGPGQFAMVSAFGAGEVPISVSSLASSELELGHTVRAVGPATAAICAAREGEMLSMRGPFGNTWPLREAEGADVVVMAGGIGLAPLRPAVRHLLEHRRRYGAVVLLYGGRTPAELLYGDELGGWRARMDAEVSVIVDAAPAEWRGRVGVVTQLIAGAPFDPASAIAMLCGPEMMIRFAAAALRAGGVSADAIHVSMERSMKCAVGHCGHCQLGPLLICRDGPVLPWPVVEPLMSVRSL